MPITPEMQTSKRAMGFPAFVVALIPNMVVIALSLPLYFVPRGSEIRPMGLAFFSFLVAVASLGIIPLSTYFMWKDRCYLWPSLAIILALLPLPLSSGMVSLAQHIKGFILEP